MKKVIALLTICTPLLLTAQGFQVSLQGQKQQAMAGTGAAMIQDGAAMYFNPGGASFLKGNSFSAGVTPVISTGKFIDANSSEVGEMTSPASFPFSAYLVMGKKDSRLKYGLAVYTPFGSIIDYEQGWSGRFVLTHLQLQSIYFQPTVSYKLSDKFGVGAGFVYGMGKVNLQRDLPISDDKGEFAKAELDGSTSGYGFNAGAYYQPSDKLSFGLVYHSQVDMKLEKGKATFTVPPSLSANFPSGNFSSSLPLPSVLTFGMAVHPMKKLAVTFDASLVGWASFDTLTFDYETNTQDLQDTKSPREYKNGTSVRLGMQYSLTDKFDIRAGIKHLGTPIRDGYVTPEVPDASHYNYSFGFGYKFGRVGVDASVTYQDMRRTDANLETGLNGTYQTKLILPGFSVNYNF